MTNPIITMNDGSNEEFKRRSSPPSLVLLAWSTSFHELKRDLIKSSAFEGSRFAPLNMYLNITLVYKFSEIS